MGHDAVKPQPKYRQLKEALLSLLHGERYAADQKLPTEDTLIRQFQVSRGTVRQAIAELENEGIVYKIQGSGTFFSGKMPNVPRSNALLGVITPRINVYIFPHIIQGITDAAQQRGYHVILGSTQTNPGEELECIEQLLAKGIDGLLIDPSFNFRYIPDAAFSKFLKTLSIPVVLMGAMVDDADISYVSLDDVEGGVKATSYLFEAGHRRIACLYPGGHISGLHRYQGYRQALETHGIAYDSRLDKRITARGDADQAGHAGIPELIRELLDLGRERPTAIVFYNDAMAVHGYRCLEQAGLCVPEDISLISFDDSERALQPKTPLTTIIHPKYYLGKWAAEMVIDQITHPDVHFPRRLLIAPTLAIRSSVRTIVQ